MLNIIINLFGIGFMQVMKIFSIYKIDDKKIKFNEKKLYIGVIMLLVFSYLSFQINIMSIRPIFTLISVFIICLLVLNKNIKKSLILAIFSVLISIVIEIVCTCFLIIFFKLAKSYSLEDIAILFDTNVVFSLIINFVCGFLQYIFSSNKYARALYKNIYSLTSNSFYRKLIKIFMFFVVLTIPGYEIFYFSNHVFLNILIFLGLLIVLIYLFISDFETRCEYEKTKQKYDSTLSDLVEYEEMIDKYRINNHENKNQLQIIRSMIKEKDKSVDMYIDNLVDTVYKSNEKILMDVSILPSGGIRATVYTKLITMDNNKIKYSLSIDRKIRSIDYFDNNPDLGLKVCNILSIFIDNAIDEVKLQKGNNRVVNFDVYYLEEDFNVVFEISNRVISDFDISLIKEKKYTTKSNGHGYGLTLAKEIIDNENRIKNVTEIVDDVFIQRIFIYIKNDKK